MGRVENRDQGKRNIFGSLDISINVFSYYSQHHTPFKNDLG
jgi:hypothetical protein